MEDSFELIDRIDSDKTLDTSVAMPMQDQTVFDTGHLSLNLCEPDDMFTAGEEHEENGNEVDCESSLLQATADKDWWKKAASIYEFTVKDIDGNDVSLEKYR